MPEDLLAARAPVPCHRFAIVGGGFGALMMQSVLRFRGVPASDIQIYSNDMYPEASWERSIRAIGQTHLRSESLGHFYPTDSPGLATVEAFVQWSVKPLVLSWFDQYNPTVEFFLSHVRQIAQQTQFHQRLRYATIDDLKLIPEGFALYDKEGKILGNAQHVIVAIGHGPVREPRVVEEFRAKYPDSPGVQHAFSGKAYSATEHVAILGDGLTAGTEWATALRAGAMVTALTREDVNFRQALNTPRPYFSKRGFERFRQQSDRDRWRELQMATRGTVRPYPVWRKLFNSSRADGRLRFIQGEVMELSLTRDHSRVQVLLLLPDGHSLRVVTADRVVVATGFSPVTQHPLLAQLIREHHLLTYQSILQVSDDFCVPIVSRPEACLGVIGPAAAWALPCADSISGMKIVAHQLADRLLGHDSWQPIALAHKTTAWLKLITHQELV